MVENEMDRKFLKKTIHRLLKDLTDLKQSYAFTDRVIRQFLQKRASQYELKGVDEELAAWVFYRFNLDETSFRSFLEDRLQKHDQLGDDLFGWVPPHREDPVLEAERLLDRIDIALNYIKTVLKMDLPPELKGTRRTDYSIRNGHFEVARCINRAYTFTQAADDVFGPNTDYDGQD